MKKAMMIPALLLAILLALSAAAQADANVAGALLGANPIPEVYAQANRSVVQVRGMKESWSMEAGASTTVGMYGTGVCLEEGYIATNWHVVYEMDYVEVETSAGQIVRAKKVYTDDSVDLAVIETGEPLEGVTPAVLGDSTALRPGDIAIVIGNTVAADIVFPNTVTAGIISGVNRSSEHMGYFNRAVPLIQLDAAVNLGQSGAGLFNTSGELIGLTAMAVNQVEDVVYEGLNFAIPSETIQAVAMDLIHHGTVQRPRMGVMVSDLDGPEEPIASYPPAGLLASEVEAGGPAEKAGMKLYDVIVEFDGVRVHSFTELAPLLDAHAPGDVVHVKVYRCLDAEGYLIDNPEYVEMDITLEILSR